MKRLIFFLLFSTAGVKSSDNEGGDLFDKIARSIDEGPVLIEDPVMSRRIIAQSYLDYDPTFQKMKSGQSLERMDMYRTLLNQISPDYYSKLLDLPLKYLSDSDSDNILETYQNKLNAKMYQWLVLAKVFSDVKQKNFGVERFIDLAAETDIKLFSGDLNRK